MKIINTGNIYDIFDDTLQTFNGLPSQAYIVRFSKNKGFFLEKYNDIEITDNKIYGVHLSKVEKVLSSFNKFSRNLGVILSGDKGIGKSLFAKLLAREAINRNTPLIVVDSYIPGIASYLESIEQEVMVLFDEFDKTYGEVKQNDGQASPQTELLTLFDGVSAGKKLFVITCNEIRRLNDYLLNRPGRFHYHFRFDYPTVDEISEYLSDKLDKQYYSEINNVIKFSRKVDLNYDCLRAIAFELNNGITFKDAIQDLNIINLEKQLYDIALKYKNGTILKSQLFINLFDN
jgi:ATP-dependent 26S proteasome regulatory subunit